MILQYLRDRKNQKRGVVVAIADENNFSVGYSLVNTKAGDRFDPSIGFQRAFGRANKILIEKNKVGYNRSLFEKPDPSYKVRYDTVTVPDSVFRQIEYFSSRAARYFKDKNRIFNLEKKSSYFSKEEQEKLNKVMDNSKRASFDRNLLPDLELERKRKLTDIKPVERGAFVEVDGETLLVHKFMGKWVVDKA